MKIDISYIAVALVVLLSGINVSLMNVIDNNSRMKIDIGLAIVFTLIFVFVYFKKRGKNENNQKG